MRYALLLYLDAASARTATLEDARAELATYGTITDRLNATGELRGGEAFMPRDSAVAVRLIDGLVSSSPVGAGESESELAGLLIVECGEARAKEIAATLPVAAHGMVEVRPLLELPSR